MAVFMRKGILPIHRGLLCQKFVFVRILRFEPEQSFFDVPFIFPQERLILVRFRIHVMSDEIPERRIDGVEGDIRLPVGVVASHGVRDLPKFRLVFAQKFYALAKRCVKPRFTHFTHERSTKRRNHAVARPCCFVSAREAGSIKARWFCAMLQHPNRFFFCGLYHNSSTAKRASRYEMVDSAPWFRLSVCWPSPS